jgi:hypothetical protein
MQEIRNLAGQQCVHLMRKSTAKLSTFEVINFQLMEVAALEMIEKNGAILSTYGYTHMG